MEGRLYTFTHSLLRKISSDTLDLLGVTRLVFITARRRVREAESGLDDHVEPLVVWSQSVQLGVLVG